MNAIYISDIYGRAYLVNFDTVKYIHTSDSEESGDLIIFFTDEGRQVISVGLDREEALDTFKRISRDMGATGLSDKTRLWR